MTLAVIFDSIGFGEWFVLLAVVLIVVGPKRLPSAARTVGQYYARFRRAAENFKRQLLDMDTEMGRVADSVEKTASDAFTSEGDQQSDESSGDYPDGSPDHDEYDDTHYGDDYYGMHDGGPDETGADYGASTDDGSDVPPDVEAVSSDRQDAQADSSPDAQTTANEDQASASLPEDEVKSPGDRPEAEVP